MMKKSVEVLMIEDDPIDQIAFSRFVESGKYNYSTTLATSLAEGKRHLETRLFDVILVDYDLGDGTAFDLLDSCKTSPIIVITGMGDEETAVRAMKKGAYEYLIKDIHSNYLKVIPITIENAINRWETQKLQNLLAHTVRCMSDAVFVTDIEGKVIFVNNSFLSTYGYDRDEIIGLTDSCLWNSENDREESLSFLKHRFNIDWNSQVIHIRKNGERFPVSISRSNVKDDYGMTFGFVAIVQDISEQTEIGAQRDQLLTDIQDILGRFRKIQASLPVDHDSRSLEDLYQYWRRVVQFLESNSSYGITDNQAGK